MHATDYQKGRVFCMGDAVHRHPPSNGLGSNTSIQDAFNLAWKLALVLKGAGRRRRCSTAITAERAPIGKQIVDRANQSIEEFGPIFEALGLLESTDPDEDAAPTWTSRKEDTEAAEEQRKKLREAIAFKVYEFDCHGVDMNQRYQSKRDRRRRLEGPGLQRRSRTDPPADDLSGRAAAACLAAEGRGKSFDPRPLRQRPLHADHRDRRRRLDRGGARRFRQGDRRRYPTQSRSGRDATTRTTTATGRRIREVSDTRLHPRASGPACRLAREEASADATAELAKVFDAILGKKVVAQKLESRARNQRAKNDPPKTNRRVRGSQMAAQPIYFSEENPRKPSSRAWTARRSTRASTR